MIDQDIQKIDEQRAEVAKEIRRYMDPFVKQDKGDIAWLKRTEDKLQNDLAKAASEFLKANGFRADGSKRKK